MGCGSSSDKKKSGVAEKKSGVAEKNDAKEVKPELVQAERESEATAALDKLVSEHCSPDLHLVEKYISEGADINARRTNEVSPTILHRIVLRGLVDVLRVCMKSTKGINFTRRDPFWGSALYCVCMADAPEVSRAMLEAIVVRIQEGHSGDEVEWEQLDEEGYDFLSLAADKQRLHILWPVVKQLPGFSTRTAPFFITATVYPFDWEQLGEERRFFSLTSGILDPTATLNALSNDGQPNILAIQSCVNDGAKVSHEKPNMKRTILHHFIFRDLVDCVEACMASRKPIDFTVRDVDGYTPLHLACLCEPQSLASEMLGILSRRILKFRAGDKVDLAQPDSQGRDVFSFAASRGILHVAWACLRELPQVMNLRARIPLTVWVAREDWNCIENAVNIFRRLESDIAMNHTPRRSILGGQGSGDGAAIMSAMISSSGDETARWRRSSLYSVRSVSQTRCGDPYDDLEMWEKQFMAALRSEKENDEVDYFTWKEKSLLRRGLSGAVYFADLLPYQKPVVVRVQHILTSPFRTVSFSADQLRQSQLILAAGEARILTKLRHKNIPCCYGYRLVHCADNSSVELFLSFIESDNLHDFIYKRSQIPLSISAVRQYTKGVLEGLTYLHSQGVVLRDLCPANLLITKEREPIIVNFGCRWSSFTEEQSICQTFKGNPMFMAPEVTCLHDAKEYSSAADIWSLGCIVLVLLGHTPWPGYENNEWELLQKLKNCTGMPPGAPRPEIHQPAKVSNLTEPISTNESQSEPEQHEQLRPEEMRHISEVEPVNTAEEPYSAPFYDFLQCCFQQDPKKRWKAEELLAHPWILSTEDNHLVEVHETLSLSPK